MMVQSKARVVIGIGVAACSGLLPGCKSRSASSLSHDFGRMTSAVAPEFTCQEQAADAEDAAYQRYARDLVDHIISSNRSVLPGIEAPDLCVMIEPIYVVNASAKHSGELRFTRGLLWVVENDAQIAAVVAHEIAHAVSQHGLAPNSHQSLLENKEYRAVCDQLVELMRGASEKADKNLEASTRKIEELVATMMKQVPGDQDRDDVGDAWLKYFEILTAFVGHTVSLNVTRPSSDKKSTYDLLSGTPFDPANRGISARFKAEEAVFQNNEDLMRMAQDARLNALGYLPSNSLEGYQASEREWIMALEKGLENSEQFKALSSKKKAFEESALGKDVSSNWQEQEADEKGLELYVRSGYDPEQFARMLEALGRHPGDVPQAYILSPNSEAEGELGGQIADRLTDHLGQNCERGSSSHPQPCWRADDVRQELIRHKEDYDKIAAKKPMATKFPGRLQKLQKSYFKGLPGDPVADQGSDADLPAFEPSADDSDSVPGGLGDTSSPPADTER